ncbi:MAG: type II secretion system F family protein [archaeon]|nr:type II secretion system F family protein [Candidatus Micrarchaeota archaeon]
MAKVSLYERISFLRDSKNLKKYELYLEHINLKVDPLLWILVSIAIASVAATITFFVLAFLELQMANILVFIVFVVVIDLLLGYPIIKENQRIGEIEGDLPDALKQMADVLKAGGTYEFALREIATSDFGPLTKEVSVVLRKLEEGENFENSLKTLSNNIDSRLVKRSVTIIIDSVKAGAGLADVLDEIAEDIRDANRIHHERRSRTLMQVLFMIAAGAVVTPFIFGLTSTIVNFLITSAATLGNLSADITQNALSQRDLLLLLLQIYIFIQVFASSVMISLMREGKKNKSIIYLPALLLLAYITYFASMVMSTSLIGGMGGAT